MAKRNKDQKVKKQRAQQVIMDVCRTKTSLFWQPLPFDKKDRFIPSSVDCLFNQEYYSRGQAAQMLRSL